MHNVCQRIFENSALKKVTQIITLTAFFIQITLSGTIVLGQQSHRISTPSTAIFNGHFVQRSLSTDTLTIRFLRDFVYHNIGADIDKIQLQSNAFHFSIDSLEHLGKVTIGVIHNKEYNRIGEFIFEPGDSIDIQIKNDSGSIIAFFEGKGRSKYECIKLLEKAKVRSQTRRYNVVQEVSDSLLTLESEKNLGKKKRAVFRLLDRFSQECTASVFSQLGILNKFKDSLSRDTYQLIEADIWGYPRLIWQLQIYSFFNFPKFGRITKSFIKDYFVQKHLQFSELKTSDYILSLSNDYILFLLYKIKIQLYFDGGEVPYSFNQQYEALKKTYKGRVREKVIALSFLNDQTKDLLAPINISAYNFCLSDAVSLVETSFVKNELLKILRIYHKGSPVDTFSLSNIKGELVTKDSFKNKVVFMDFWGTGCSACAFFSKKFEKEIYPFFKNDNRFVYLSVCIDESKTQWKASLQRQLYTFSGAIDVYTQGLGERHPLLQYYGIQALPFLLLMDKNGNFYARLSVLDTSSEIMGEIQKALGE
jgi:hypothetical protein